jgi:hypothetical protein
MFAAAGNGNFLPPMCALKSPSGHFYDTWAQGGPEGSVFVANKAGWFNMRECETWFDKVFLKYLEANIPKEEVKVLIMDNLSSHLSFTIMEQCRENNIRLIFLPPNSTHLTQPLDVAVFAPLKKQWRKELDSYKQFCVENNIKNVTIPKDKFAGLLKSTLENNAVINAKNIQAGFAACGIIPLNPDRVLSRLPPENIERQGVQEDMSQQLLDELKKVRYGEPEKKKRARKANRLPPGTAYTVSAVPATEEQAGPSGVAASGDGAAGRGRGTASKKAKTEAWRVNANLYVSSDEDDSDYYDNMGADSDDNGGGSSEDEEEEREGEEEEEPAAVEVEYDVGDFVAAVYEDQWLLAQVDIDQDKAGKTHVNLTYMERVGKNAFKWPKQDDRLLTLREDILFKCSAPVLVGSSLRANHVGLCDKEAAVADATLALVVYLTWFDTGTKVPGTVCTVSFKGGG